MACRFPSKAFGVQGTLRAQAAGSWQLWGGPLAKGCVVALLINLGTEPLVLAVSWAQLGVPPGQRMDVFDLWDGAARRQRGALSSIDVAAPGGGNDCALYRLCPAAV